MPSCDVKSLPVVLYERFTVLYNSYLRSRATIPEVRMLHSGYIALYYWWNWVYNYLKMDELVSIRLRGIVLLLWTVLCGRVLSPGPFCAKVVSGKWVWANSKTCHNFSGSLFQRGRSAMVCESSDDMLKGRDVLGQKRNVLNELVGLWITVRDRRASWQCLKSNTSWEVA